MSSIQVPSNIGRIDLGYDALIDSYFIQVRKPDAAGNLQLSEWLGSGVASVVCDDLIHDPEIVTRRASVHGRVPDGFADSLRADRAQGPKLVAVKRVTYAGMPTQEVWRQRGGFDPDHGTRIDVREHEIYAWSRQVAYAILIDVLGHKLRARKLASDFGGLIESQIYKPYWLLTETDIQSGIFEVESRNDLRWIPSLLCYASKGMALDLSAEAQLCRAANNVEAGQPLEPGRINLCRGAESTI